MSAGALHLDAHVSFSELNGGIDCVNIGILLRLHHSASRLRAHCIQVGQAVPRLGAVDVQSVVGVRDCQHGHALISSAAGKKLRRIRSRCQMSSGVFPLSLFVTTQFSPNL